MPEEIKLHKALPLYYFAEGREEWRELDVLEWSTRYYGSAEEWRTILRHIQWNGARRKWHARACICGAIISEDEGGRWKCPKLQVEQAERHKAKAARKRAARAALLAVNGCYTI